MSRSRLAGHGEDPLAEAYVAGIAGRGLNPLLERMRHGSEGERAAVLEELAAKTQVLPLNPNALNVYGIALLTAERRYAAVAVLSRSCREKPAESAFRLNLALACWYAGCRGLTRHHLESVIEGGHADENMIAVANGRLREYFGDEVVDRELHQLQRAALSERRQAGNVDAFQFIALARLIEAEVASPADEGLFDEALSVLEEGHRLHPHSVPLLERLSHGYIRAGRLEDYDRILLSIERDAARSATLEALESGLDPSDAGDKRAFNQTLVGDVFQAGNPRLREAALADLAQRAARLPHDEDLRTAYAFALLFAGERERAVEQGEWLLAKREASHELHFNLGQLFWKAGDEARGRHHLDLASELAGSDRERQDVEFILARMSSGG